MSDIPDTCASIADEVMAMLALFQTVEEVLAACVEEEVYGIPKCPSECAVSQLILKRFKGRIVSASYCPIPCSPNLAYADTVRGEGTLAFKVAHRFAVASFGTGRVVAEFALAFDEGKYPQISIDSLPPFCDDKK